MGYWSGNRWPKLLTINKMEWLDFVDKSCSDDDVEEGAHLSNGEACLRQSTSFYLGGLEKSPFHKTSEQTATTEHTESDLHRRDKSRAARLKKRAWTREEDAELARLILKHGADWTLLVTHFPDRTSGCLQERWEASKAEGWTSSEDRKIQGLVKLYGTNWKELSKHLYRPASEIKTRYFQLQSEMDLDNCDLALNDRDLAAEEAEKSQQLGELYQQVDIMRHYLESLQVEMQRLQAGLAETLDH